MMRTVAREMMITLDGQTAKREDLANFWGKASDPIHALENAPGEKIEQVIPYIWGMLISSRWEATRITDEFADSHLTYESGDKKHSLECDLITDYSRDGIDRLIIRIVGDDESDVPEIIASVDFPESDAIVG